MHTVPLDRRPDRPRAMEWERYAETVTAQWRDLLGSDPEEAAVQAFLELHPAMIPGGSGDIGPGGHHGSSFEAVFTRPPLEGAGRAFEPDFMWVTRSTGAITPILIEIERPTKRWFNQAGNPTAHLTQARGQLNDWRSWFDRPENISIFRDRYLLSTEKIVDRPIIPQYLLIYGRESEFSSSGPHKNPEALRFKRDGMRAQDEFFMTFDSIIPKSDQRSSMTLKMTATGPVALAFSPLFGTGARTGEMASIVGELDEGLNRTVMLTASRRAYLKDRIRFWHADFILGKEHGLRAYQLGIE